ncbi:MAG: hypothetical protein ACLVJ6_03610 [Merdibacter sp.]
MRESSTWLFGCAPFTAGTDRCPAKCISVCFDHGDGDPGTGTAADPLPWLSSCCGCWQWRACCRLLGEIQRTRRKWHAWKLYGIAERHFLCLQLYRQQPPAVEGRCDRPGASLSCCRSARHSSACLPAFFALTLGYLLIVVLLPSLLLADLCYRRL